MAKKALGDIPVATQPEPKARRKAKPKVGGDTLNTAGYGPKKQPPHKVSKRRAIFIADEFFNPVKERAAAETRRRGEKVSPSEIIREAIVAYLDIKP